MNVVEQYLKDYFVTPAWVAKHYGVSRTAVHRAILAGRLTAAPIEGAVRPGWVLDRRLLPLEFPRA